MIKIEGWCPYGCGQTLYLRLGIIECSYAHCPNPTGVTDLIVEDAKELGHIVKLTREGFSIQHPLKERIDRDLFHCGLHEYLDALAAGIPKWAPGNYLVQETPTADAPWEFSELHDG